MIMNIEDVNLKNVVRRSLFSDIDLSDSFFDSLKSDYLDFFTWFAKKSNSGEYAFVVENEHRLSGFLYVKKEMGDESCVYPPLPKSKVLKVGSLKIESSGKGVGARFIRSIVNYAKETECSHVYFTVFDKYPYVVNVFKKVGFKYHGIKQSQNGLESVYLCDVNLLS